MAVALVTFQKNHFLAESGYSHLHATVPERGTRKAGDQEGEAQPLRVKAGCV